jgi:hypothetical protein
MFRLKKAVIGTMLSLGMLTAMPLAASAGCVTSTESVTTTDCVMFIFCSSHTVTKTTTVCGP